nr:hypothetical protein CFP56_51793 [Quercus suber]
MSRCDTGQLELTKEKNLLRMKYANTAFQPLRQRATLYGSVQKYLKYGKPFWGVSFGRNQIKTRHLDFPVSQVLPQASQALSDFK